MAKNKVFIDIVIDDKGTTKRVAVNAKKLGIALEETGKGARSADRNLKGVAQASANGTKNFSKMAQGISGSLVPAYATLAANIFAITAAFGFLKRAADVSVLIQAQQSYTQSTGVGLKGISESLREASGQMLTFRDAASAAAIGVAKGFSPKQLEDLAVGARRASAALGRDFEDAFDRLVRGTSKAEPELLDELGITLRLEKATKDYAATIGKNVKALTAYERSQAVLIETQRQLDEQFGAVDAAVNPFQQLAVTFNDIVKAATQFLLPVFEAIANIINRSATAAIIVFGALAVSIAKAAIPIDDIKRKFGEFQDKQAAAITDARARADKYTESLRKNKAEIEALNKSAAATVQKNAKQLTATPGGSKSKIIQKAAAGEQLTGVDKANIKKALKSAEAQYARHGKIKTGIFKGADIEIVRSFTLSMKKMDASAKGTSTKIGLYFGVASANISVGLARMSAAGSRAFAGLGRAAAFAGGVMNKALRFAGVVGIVVMLVEVFMSLKNSIFDISISIIRIADKVFNAIIGSVNKVKSSFFGVVANVAEGLGMDETASSFRESQKEIDNYSGSLTTLEDKFRNSGAGVLIKDIQDSGVAARESNEAYDAFSSSLSNFKKDFTAATRGMEEAAKAGNEVKEALIRLNAAATSGMEQKLNKVFDIKDTGDRKKAYDELKEAILEQKSLFPTLAAIVSDSSLSYGEMAQQLIAAQKSAGAATAAQTALTESITSARTVINSSSSDLYALREAYENVNSAANAATATAREAGESFDGQAKATDNLGESIEEASKRVEGYLAIQRAIKEETATQDQAESRLGRLTPQLSAYLKDKLGVERMLTKEKQLQLELTVLEDKLERLEGKEDTTQLSDQIKEKQNAIKVLQQQLEDEERRVSDIGRIGDAAADSFESSFINAFSSVIQGTMSVKDAFFSMAKGVLQALSQVIAKLIAIKLLEMAIGFFNFGGAAKVDAMQAGTLQSIGVPDAGDIRIARYGGVMKEPKGYGTGGIATGRDGGYPAVLHGTEAVVPLPNNRSIPVDLQGNTGSTNNVTVNVAIDSNGQTSQTEQSDGMQGANLGKAIAAAVQQEIMNQRRNGGMLSPYGAA